GSEQGSVIPERTISGRKQTFIRDENGELVQSKLDAKALEDRIRIIGNITVNPQNQTGSANLIIILIRSGSSPGDAKQKQ
ncbi:hypothetical protein OAF35_05595, partial [Verrucomicrobiales bacterium]|nr:hypothetical protein [Verrucomicrobiales bacterium]